MTPIQTERSPGGVRLNIPALVAIVLAAAVVGGIVGSYLPFGDKSPTVQSGLASWTDRGGTFEADQGGTSAFLPSQITWTDRAGTLHHNGVPDCLAPSKSELANGAVTEARVEAAYVWVRPPEGGNGGPVVTWLRCL